MYRYVYIRETTDSGTVLPYTVLVLSLRSHTRSVRSAWARTEDSYSWLPGYWLLWDTTRYCPKVSVVESGGLVLETYIIAPLFFYMSVCMSTPLLL